MVGTVDAEVKNFRLTSGPSKPIGTSTLTEFDVNNNSSRDQTPKVSNTVGKSRTITTEVTHGIKLGVKLSASMKLEQIFELSAEKSMEISVSSTRRQSQAATETLSVDIPATVPSRTRLQAVYKVDSVQIEPTFTADVMLNASRGVRVQVSSPQGPNGHGGHRILHVPIQDIFANEPGFSRGSGRNDVVFEIRGKLTTAKGARVWGDIHECSIPEGARSCDIQ